MYLKRKAYNKLLQWKKEYADRYAVLIEGARRVGKSTLAEHFAKNEYSSYILIDFAKVSGRQLYYHTWEKEGSTHYYEVDFLISRERKIIPIEVKSSGLGKHESLTEFAKKYSKNVAGAYVLSQKDFAKDSDVWNLPIYMTPFLAEQTMDYH